MFPDSVITYNFKCGEVKSAYLFNHEITPYFKSLLINKLKNGSHDFVLLFDKSMKSKIKN